MLTRHSDPQGRVTEYRYAHGLNQPVERIDPAGNRLHYEYDQERLLTALINENGDRYQFFYDGEERLIKEIGFDGRVQAYEYNAAGHLIRHLDSDEVEHQFERDALGRLLKKTSRSLITRDNEFSQYRYDNLSRLTESHNQHQFVGFAYDAHGNITQEIQADLEAGRAIPGTTQKIQHRYNLMGERIATLLADGNEIHYHYGPSGGFTALRYNAQLITQIERNSLGQEQQRHQGALTTHSDYDPQGRLIKQQAQHQQGRQTLIQRDYRYSASGNLASLKESGRFGSHEVNYLYDTLDRLKRTEGSHPEFFSFDPAGNLVSIADTARAPKGQSQGNRLRMQGDAKFDYDARGNLIEERRDTGGKLKRTFCYDLSNQLIEVDNQQQRVRYTYDPLGRRINKTDNFGTTTFQWSGQQLISETRNNIKKTYLFEPNSHRPVAQVHDGQIYHYHLDCLGTPQELTNNAGDIVWKARYKTYGALALKAIDDVENNLRFQGQYFDTETGLHYNRFRYYHPNTGQFINQDPIGLLGGINSYQYADNPVNWVDPLGLCKSDGSKSQEIDQPFLGNSVRGIYEDDLIN